MNCKITKLIKQLDKNLLKYDLNNKLKNFQAISFPKNKLYHLKINLKFFENLNFKVIFIINIINNRSKLRKKADYIHIALKYLYLIYLE